MSLRYSLATASALILAGAATAGAAESTPLTGTEWGYSYGAFFTLHDDGTIGGNATILAGVTVGRGATVGAGSVVTKVRAHAG